MITLNTKEYTGGTLFAQLIEVSGWRGALEGMRNPKNSWRLNDTKYIVQYDTAYNGEINPSIMADIGANDMRLAQTLIKAGGEHRKFLRMIHVQVNLNLPRYIWSEFDTYHFNTKNSTSTMHKLLNEDDEKDWRETELDRILSTRGDLTIKNFFIANEDIETIECTIAKLNEIKELFFEAKTTAEKKHLRRRAKQLLPESWLQMRTVDTNYEELRNIFLQRQHHLLDLEWTLVCDFIKSLPYAEELILHATKKGEQ